LTGVILPWVALSLAFKLFPDEVDALLIVGDVLSVTPPFAFLRGLGAVSAVSRFSMTTKTCRGRMSAGSLQLGFFL
jgi:hypothetical protein